MKNQIEEMNIFCFRAVLGKVDGKGEFIVPFKVLSEDKYKAQSILEDWLKNPEQTGYKFTCCEGLVREPSERVLAKGYRKASDVAREIFEAIYGISIGCSVENDVMRLTLEKEPYVLVVLASAFDKLRKKYIGEDTNVTTKESEGGE